MTKRTTRVLIVICSLALFSLGTIGFVIGSILYSFDFTDEYPHRSDAEMIQVFREHRAEFEKVRSMALADRLVARIDEDWTTPANLDPETVARYRELFAVIKTPRGINIYRESGDIELLASTIGWVASGSTKGYIYNEIKPRGTIVGSLDDPTGLNIVEVRYLKPIDGNWYLYFER
jgi:hypothetical protein